MNKDNIGKTVDEIRDQQKRELSLLGILFVVVVTMTTNLWAQYIYHNFIDSLEKVYPDNISVLILFSIIALVVITLYAYNVNF